MDFGTFGHFMIQADSLNWPKKCDDTIYTSWVSVKSFVQVAGD